MSGQLVIQLNEEIVASTELVRQTLGERITLSTSLAPRLVPIRADADRLRAALMDVAAGARDAMPHGGRFVIETRNVVVTKRHSNISRVQHVQLSITHGGTPIPRTDLSSAYSSLLETGGRITVKTDDEPVTTVNFDFPVR